MPFAGLETARALSCYGAKVIMACRNISKTKKIIQTIKRDRVSFSKIFHCIVNIKYDKPLRLSNLAYLKGEVQVDEYTVFP